VKKPVSKFAFQVHNLQRYAEAAEGWSREEKDRCLEETGKSFQLSGQLLRLIA
jgi:hypothetical protein